MYFSTSSTRMTGKDNQSTASHSDAFSAVTENMAAAGGTYRMKQCNAIDSAIEPSSHMLLQGGSCRTPHIHHAQQGICMHAALAVPTHKSRDSSYGPSCKAVMASDRDPAGQRRTHGKSSNHSKTVTNDEECQHAEGARHERLGSLHGKCTHAHLEQ